MRKPCCDKQDTNKGAWSKQEDQKLIDYIREHGEGCWRTLPQAAGLLRCGKSCRLRWINYLRPDLKRGNFDEDEEELIVKLHALLGNRWSLIAGRLPGRTDNEVKNYWNSHLRRKLMKMGIDPNNHRLNHIIPRQVTQVPDNNVSTSTASSSLKVRASPSRKSQENDIDEKECDAKNSSEEVPDLNLDLAISFQSTSQAKDVEELNPTIFKMASESLKDQSPTLLLFR